MGYSDLIGQHLAEVQDTSQKHRLEAVARACKRLLPTFNAVLDYAKIKSRPFPVKLRAVPLIPLMRRLIEELEPQASQKGLRPAFGFEGTAAAATIDEYSLRHSLRNLLKNAIKFTERGDVTMCLYRDASALLCVSISDTGIGVGRAYLPRLLEPFSQEDSIITRRFEGAGLGLALTHRCLE